MSWIAIQTVVNISWQCNNSFQKSSIAQLLICTNLRDFILEQSIIDYKYDTWNIVLLFDRVLCDGSPRLMGLHCYYNKQNIILSSPRIKTVAKLVGTSQACTSLFI